MLKITVYPNLKHSTIYKYLILVNNLKRISLAYLKTNRVFETNYTRKI